MALATTTELALVLGVGLDAAGETRAQEVLELASADVAGYCDLVSLERTVDDVIELAGSYEPALLLPGGPVVNVAEVRINGTIVTDWRTARRPDRLVRGSADLSVYPFSPLGDWGGSDATVTVTYTHGFSEPPDEVRSTVLAVAQRRWNQPVGVRAEQLGAESVTYETGAPVGLGEEQQRALSRFHRSSESVNVA